MITLEEIFDAYIERIRELHSDFLENYVPPELRIGWAVFFEDEIADLEAHKLDIRDIQDAKMSERN